MIWLNSATILLSALFIIPALLIFFHSATFMYFCLLFSSSYQSLPFSLSTFNFALFFLSDVSTSLYFSHRVQSRWQVFLEQLSDPVVLLDEDDVEGGEEGVLVHSHLAGHEVVDLLGLQQARVRTNIQLKRWQVWPHFCNFFVTFDRFGNYHIYLFFSILFVQWSLSMEFLFYFLFLESFNTFSFYA